MAPAGRCCGGRGKAPGRCCSIWKTFLPVALIATEAKKEATISQIFLLKCKNKFRFKLE